jgi:hypothetical protein
MPDQPEPAPIADVSSLEAKPRLSRREFARRAALASAVASLAPAAAVAVPSIVGQSATQDPPRATPPPVVAPQNPPPNAPKLSVESQSEADARFQSILVLYGSRFSNEQKIDLHRLCAVVQSPLDHIRAYKIENGDGPALYLKPQYEREKKPKPAAVSAKPSPGQSGPAKSTPAPKPAPPATAPKKP